VEARGGFFSRKQEKGKKKAFRGGKREAGLQT